jgi:hypothetical protein
LLLADFPCIKTRLSAPHQPICCSSGDIDPLSSSDFVVVYSSMALFQIEPELDSTGGLDVAMFAQGADEFITGSSATVFA